MSDQPPKRPNPSSPRPAIRPRASKQPRGSREIEAAPRAKGGDEGHASDRPTLNPPFDVEAFARVASAPSVSPLSSTETPTNRPPPPAADEFDAESRSEQITLTNEVELERARAQSAVAPPAPRTITSSALAIANARASSSPAVRPTDPQSSRDSSGTRVAARAPSAPNNIEAAVLGALDGSPAPEITQRTIEDPVAEMRERFSLGDYSGALEMSELILAGDPGHVEAAECGENCRTVLENMYAARLGPLERIPMVVVPRTQMRWLSMDHRAGFVLSLIDGQSTIEMLLDVCGMPKLDALRILQDLVQQKIVSFR